MDIRVGQGWGCIGLDGGSELLLPAWLRRGVAIPDLQPDNVVEKRARVTPLNAKLTSSLACCLSPRNARQGVMGVKGVLRIEIETKLVRCGARHGGIRNLVGPNLSGLIGRRTRRPCRA